MKKFFITIMTKLKSDELFVKYVIVGIWNTFLGNALYILFTYMLESVIAFSYIAAFIFSNFISITCAFLMHKYIVFKSYGNLWHEYKKCWIVYGASMILSVILLPICVRIISYLLPYAFQHFDKYIAGLVISGISAIASFIGHNKFTFTKN